MLSAAGVLYLDVFHTPTGIVVELPADTSTTRTPDVTAAIIGVNATPEIRDVIGRFPTVSLRDVSGAVIETKRLPSPRQG